MESEALNEAYRHLYAGSNNSVADQAVPPMSELSRALDETDTLIANLLNEEGSLRRMLEPFCKPLMSDRKEPERTKPEKIESPFVSTIRSRNDNLRKLLANLREIKTHLEL